MFKMLKSITVKLLLLFGFFCLITIFIEIPSYVLGEYQLNDYWTVGLMLIYFLSMLLTYMCFNRAFQKYPLCSDLDKSSSKINMKFLLSVAIFAVIRLSWLFIYGWLFEKLGLSLPDNEVALVEAEDKLRTLTDFAAIVQAPIFEELLFRKTLMHLFFDKTKGLAGEVIFVLISAFAFAFVHDSSFGPNFFLAYFASGFIYATAYRVTKDIRVPILVHMLSNLITSL